MPTKKPNNRRCTLRTNRVNAQPSVAGLRLLDVARAAAKRRRNAMLFVAALFAIAASRPALAQDGVQVMRVDVAGPPAVATSSPLPAPVGSQLGYSNTGAAALVPFPGAGVPMADDLRLNVCQCTLDRLEFRVSGGGDGTGPGFGVFYNLINGCPSAGGSQITGTGGSLALPHDGDHIVAIDYETINILIPGDLWLRLHVNTPAAGWYGGTQAETGSTENHYAIHNAGCDHQLKPPLHAGFHARVFCKPLASDCNANNSPDLCDIEVGISDDCNTNFIPDECDIADGTSHDCNSDGVPDSCTPPAEDCNSNGIPDVCDMADGTSDDCNRDGLPDECTPLAEDCNDNDSPDVCDLAAGISLDCDGDGLPDECTPHEQDCNQNRVPDTCDMATGAYTDCNNNGVLDDCEIAGALEIAALHQPVPDEDDALFGRFVAMADGLALVGQPTDRSPDGFASGAGYLYDVTDPRHPALLSKIAPADLSEHVGLGWGVALSGNIAILGAVFDEPLSINLFDISDPFNPIELTKIPIPGMVNDSFCDDFLAASGNVIAVGAPSYYVGNGLWPGAVHLFDISDPAAPTALPILLASDMTNGADFGYSLDIDGDRMVVGTGPWRSSDAGGAAYVFDVTNWDAPVEIAKLTPAIAQSGDRFGRHVVIDDGVIAVAAPGYDGPAGLDQGAVYLFDLSQAKGDNEIARLTAYDAEEDTDFGETIAIDAGVLIAASIGDFQSPFNYTPGTAYLFDVRDPANPNSLGKLEKDALRFFGISAALHNGLALIGVTGYNSQSYFGLAPLFDLSKSPNDCNANHVPDDCDLAGGVSQDCDENDVPDECVAAAQDCNGNLVPDYCERWLPDADCNNNYRLDECESDQLNEAIKFSINDDLSRFGRGLAVSGDLAVVASINYSLDPSVVVYVMDISDPSEPVQLSELTPSDNVDGDFGNAVAIDGSLVVVGNRYHDAVYVYDVSDPTHPVQRARLLHPSGEGNDSFGTSVAIHSGRLLVGAPGAGYGDSNGAAFLYEVNNSDSPELLATMRPAELSLADDFGSAVALSADRALIGDERAESPTGAWSGAVHVLDISDPQNPVELARVLASDGDSGDFFGASVAIDGYVGLVGAFRSDTGSIINHGAAYIIDLLNPTTGVELSKLTPSGLPYGAFFGASVALTNGLALVGAYLEDGVNGDEHGAAYLFDVSDLTQPSEIARFTSFDGSAGDNFGYEVAMNDSVALVGAILDDVDGNTDQGSVSVIHLSAQTIDCNGNGQRDMCEAIDGADFDGNAAIDWLDYQRLHNCHGGPDAWPQPDNPQCRSICLQAFDADNDGDIDLYDHAAFARSFAP